MPDFKDAITAALTSLKAVSDADMRSLATAQKITNNTITRGEQDEYDPRSTRDRPEIDDQIWSNSSSKLLVGRRSCFDPLTVTSM